jgi:hypothetical protein
MAKGVLSERDPVASAPEAIGKTFSLAATSRPTKIDCRFSSAWNQVTNVGKAVADRDGR